jgi:hypothetical protein
MSVARPVKRNEFQIVFITREAEKGWTDCLAAARNAVTDAWDRLTAAPTSEDERCYRLRADLATGVYNGVAYERYQYKITDGGRLWYFVEVTPKGKFAGTVMLERCTTGHPNESDGAKNYR